MDLVLNMARPITTTPEARLKEHTYRIRVFLAELEQTNPAAAHELLRLSAIISWELQCINSLTPKK